MISKSSEWLDTEKETQLNDDDQSINEQTKKNVMTLFWIKQTNKQE